MTSKNLDPGQASDRAKLEITDSFIARILKHAPAAAPARAGVAGVKDISRLKLSSLEELAKDVCPMFAQFAKAPDTNLEEVFYDVPFVFLAYTLSNTLPEDEVNLERLLYDVKPKAAALLLQLQKVHQNLEKRARQRKKEKKVDRRLRRNIKKDDHKYIAYTVRIAGFDDLLPKVTWAIEGLSALTNGLGNLTAHGRGRRAGVKRYPGLYQFVIWLEVIAWLAGGGFTVHRKLGAKGGLIQALDWFRNRLAANPDLKHLSNLIPPPGQHPVAVYERALKSARKSILAATASR